jgi:hypothetical protein
MKKLAVVVGLVLLCATFNVFARTIDTEIQETEKASKFLKELKIVEKEMGTTLLISMLIKSYGFKETEVGNYYGSKLDQKIELLENRLTSLKQQKTAQVDCESVYQTDAVFTGVNDVADDMIKSGRKSGGVGGVSNMLYGGVLKLMYGAIPQGVQQGNPDCYQK